jgi:hypothetical protein
MMDEWNGLDEMMESMQSACYDLPFLTSAHYITALYNSTIVCLPGVGGRIHT